MIDTSDILKRAMEECERQKVLWGEQNHPSFCYDIIPQRGGVYNVANQFYGVPTQDVAKERCEGAAKNKELTWAHIALEEFAESFAETNDDDALIEELIQTIAVLASWVESIERNRKNENEED